MSCNHLVSYCVSCDKVYNMTMYNLKPVVDKALQASLPRVHLQLMKSSFSTSHCFRRSELNSRNVQEIHKHTFCGSCVCWICYSRFTEPCLYWVFFFHFFIAVCLNDVNVHSLFVTGFVSVRVCILVCICVRARYLMFTKMIYGLFSHHFGNGTGIRWREKNSVVRLFVFLSNWECSCQ